MPRLKAIEPTTKVTVYLPASFKASLDLHLFSEVEGRVPHGARQAFVFAAIRQALFGQDSEIALLRDGVVAAIEHIRGEEAITEARYGKSDLVLKLERALGAIPC